MSQLERIVVRYKAILFDMDGTLLPMDTHDFSRQYFKSLYAKLAKHGLKAENFGDLMWAGVAAMVKNDGSKTNEDAFWEAFEPMTGLKKDAVNGDCLEFYGNEFHQAKAFTQENPLAAEAVRLAHEKAEQVVLATNPLFPMVGQITRMSWIGLSPADFALVTSYESDSYCKPNPKYFLSVCERIGVKPEECLMIGNDEGEDMYAGTLAGLNCYLVTDWMIPNEKHPWEGDRGTFSELIEMLKAL